MKEDLLNYLGKSKTGNTNDMPHESCVEGLVEIRNQLSIPKKSSDDFYQHLKMKKISRLNYPHPT